MNSFENCKGGEIGKRGRKNACRWNKRLVGSSPAPSILSAVIFSFSVGFLPLTKRGLGEILSPNSVSVLGYQHGN
jgi:hypothetical protein